MLGKLFYILNNLLFYMNLSIMYWSALYITLQCKILSSDKLCERKVL